MQKMIREVRVMDIKDSTFMEGFKRLTADAFKKGWHERNGGNLTYRVKPEGQVHAQCLAGTRGECRADQDR